MADVPIFAFSTVASMITNVYYILLAIYGIALVAYLSYYLSRKAPTGDASVGWALGVFYMAGLAGVLVIAFNGGV